MHQGDSIASQGQDTIAPAPVDTAKEAMPQPPFQMPRPLPEDAGVPEFHIESFFSKDSLYSEEVYGGQPGVAGDPVPYALKNDNTISLLMILSFILSVLSISRSRRFIVRQAKGLIFSPVNERSFESETSSEIWFQAFMVLLTSMLIAILQYFYTQNYIGTTFILPSQYHLIAVYFGMALGYFIVRGLIYAAVNPVFFSRRKSLQWLKSLLFITSVEGALLFPVVLLQTYFDLSMKTVSIYVVIVFSLVKILTFYKCYIIFFRQIGFFLQIILYFCALELVPIVAFWGALVITGNNLKINF